MNDIDLKNNPKATAECHKDNPIQGQNQPKSEVNAEIDSLDKQASAFLKHLQSKDFEQLETIAKEIGKGISLPQILKDNPDPGDSLPNTHPLNSSDQPGVHSQEPFPSPPSTSGWTNFLAANFRPFFSKGQFEGSKFQIGAEKTLENSSELNSNEALSTILLQDINGQFLSIEVDPFTFSVKDLCKEYGALMSIPADEIRCFYKGLNLAQRDSFTFDEINGESKDAIQLRLALRGGGGGEGPVSQETPLQMNEEVENLDQLVGALELVPGLFSGHDDLPKPHKYSFEQELLSGEDIALVLEKMVGDKAYVIHPDALSLHSVFAPDLNIAKSGAQDLAEYIFDAVCMEIQDKELSFISPPALDKPVIVVLNTSGGKDLHGKIRPFDFYGSHWLSLVILPKNFNGLIPPSSDVKSDLSVERIYLFDSLPSNRKIPEILKSVLIDGVKDAEMEGVSWRKFVPSCISRGALWFERTSKKLQSAEDNNCGFWALANAIMATVSGSDLYWQKLPDLNSEESTLRKTQVGLYLRQLFKKILIRSKKPKKVWKPNSFQEKSAFLSPQTESAQLTGTKEPSTPNGVFKKESSIALNPLMNQPEVRLTKKGTPDRRIKSNRAYKLPEKKKMDNKKRKLLEISSLHPLEDPENLSPISKQVKMTEYISLNANPQNKIYIHLEEFREQQQNFARELQNLKAQLDEKDKQSMRELDNLVIENNDLKRKVHIQSEYIEKFLVDVKEAITTLRSEVEILCENQKAGSVLDPNCVEGIINRSFNVAEEVNRLKVERLEMRNVNEVQVTDLLQQVESLKSQISTLQQQQVVDARELGTRLQELDHFIQDKAIGRMEEELPKPVLVDNNNNSSPPMSDLSKPNSRKKLESETIKQVNRTGKRTPTLLIPWEGRILTPTRFQLLKFGGSMNEICKNIGSRLPVGRERNFIQAKIFWKGEYLWATPQEIQEALGNLDSLADLLPESKKVKGKYFFQGSSGTARSYPPTNH